MIARQLCYYVLTDTKVEETEAAEIILVRSAKMHEMEFEPEVKVIARAGAGVNNIPLDRCAEQGIVVFNTPGANANGVKELFIFAAIASIRDIVGGISWTASQAGNADIAALTEKGKKQFAGNEISGKTLGVIGLGAIGAKVANAAVALGMQVIGFDAFLSDAMKASLDPAVEIASSNEEVVAASDMITIHVPALPSTIGMVGRDLLAKAKDGLVVINLARDTLVDTEAMREALESGKVAKYVCDFPTGETSDLPNTILIPHLGASTEESEDNCAVMAVQEIRDFLENGNIKNSVNYPAVSLGKCEGTRVTVCHRADVDGAAIADILKGEGSQVAGMASKARGDFGYTIIDVDQVTPSAEQALKATNGIIRMRVID